MKLGIPPKASSDADYTPPPKGIYECIVSSLEEIANPFYEKNLAEWEAKGQKGAKPDDKQVLWKFAVADGEHKGFEYWYYTGVRLGRSPKNKFTNLLRILYPGFCLDDGAEVVPNDESELRKGVMYKPVRIVGDVIMVDKKQDDGTTKKVPRGKVSDIWESERPADNTESIKAALESMGGEIISDEIPY